MKRVLADSGLPDLSEELSGQTAFVTGASDVCAVAKVVANFQKEFESPVVKAGILDGDVLSAEQVKGLAALPPREVLLAQLLSTINAPASKLVRTLNEPGGSLARVIKAKFNEG
jgi:large subunit ribosomal protein L10